MKRKIGVLIGAVVVAVPATIVATLTVPPMLAGAATPSYPVVCTMSATVSFSPPLTKAGTDTTNKAAVTTTTISNGRLSNCESAASAGAPTSGTIPTLTITTAAAKGSKVDKVQHYTIGSCPDFASTTTLKSLKHLTITVSWSGGEGGTSTFVNKSAAAAVNSFGEVGFAFSSKAGPGSYSEKALDQITAYIDAADSTALATGCSANQTVSSVTIDPTHSVAIL